MYKYMLIIKSDKCCQDSRSGIISQRIVPYIVPTHKRLKRKKTYSGTFII